MRLNFNIDLKKGLLYIVIGEEREIFILRHLIGSN